MRDAINPIALACLLVFLTGGCSLRYADRQGYDTLIGFPPRLNTVEQTVSPDGRLTWRRMRRTGLGLDISRQSIGFMIGYADIFLLWVEGDGAWELTYSRAAGMHVSPLVPPASGDAGSRP